MSEEQTTLRDALTSAYESAEAAQESTATPAPAPAPAAAETAPAAAPGETAKAQAQEKSAADERARDAQGRFVPKSESAAEPAKPATPPAPQEAATPPAQAAEPRKIGRPSSWKKDYWEAFDKLATENPQVAEYILQREHEAARGVSAYKAEWDRARPLLDAITPHLQLFQQHGVDPGQQIGRYVEIHKGLAFGTDDQKLGVLLRIAQDYKIPLEKMFVQQNGQVFYNPQVQPMAPQPQAAPPIETTVRTILQQERSAQEISAMAADRQKYPHFEAVRDTMARLLEAGEAEDLPGAYEAALALPRHRELIAEQQRQQQAREEADRKAKAAAEAQRARAAAVSPKSATPATAPAQARKGLRDILSAEIDARMSGRV